MRSTGNLDAARRPEITHFPETLIRLSRELIARGEIEPFALVLPVFRFEGRNWPGFLLDEFIPELTRLLRPHGVDIERPLLLGHSGALGCGGDGLNHPLRIHPGAVGLFDTCIGKNFVTTLRALSEHRVPTWIVQSVETAGVVPRHVPEYDAGFDFGSVFRDARLDVLTCPTAVPRAPLRQQPYRCAIDATGSVRAFVVDTGSGEAAHEAALVVGAEFFLRSNLGRTHTDRSDDGAPTTKPSTAN
ncbi:MAG: hypothetical protein QM784_03630 [Polyangiaceae bacterium]